MESPAIKTLYTRLTAVIPGLRFGGIYAVKPGYHNRRDALPIGDYSVQLSVDRQGPSNLASALDLTMSTAEMKRRTGYLRRAALNPVDDRTSYIREFIGTLDGSTVYCLIASGPGTAFHEDDSRDDSHLWHIHISFYRLYANDSRAMEALLSVLSGETYEQWAGRDDMTPEEYAKLYKKVSDTHHAVTQIPKLDGTGREPLQVWAANVNEVLAVLLTNSQPLDYDRLAQAIVREALAQTQAQ